MNLTIRRATTADLLLFLSDITSEDTAEIYAMHACSPETAITAYTGEILCGLVDNKPIAIYGLAGCHPWMLVTTRFPKYPLQALRATKVVLRSWLCKHPVLSNYAWANNVTHLRFLRNAGAVFTDVKLIGPFREPFVEFKLCAHPQSLQSPQPVLPLQLLLEPPQQV